MKTVRKYYQIFEVFEDIPFEVSENKNMLRADVLNAIARSGLSIYEYNPYTKGKPDSNVHIFEDVIKINEIDAEIKIGSSVTVNDTFAYKVYFQITVSELEKDNLEKLYNTIREAITKFFRIMRDE